MLKYFLSVLKLPLQKYSFLSFNEVQQMLHSPDLAYSQ